MPKKTLINRLKLSYAPVSNYDFSTVKNDELIRSYMNSGHIYIIAQRPILTFEKFNIITGLDNITQLTFEIHQRGNPGYLDCSFPIFQESLCSHGDQSIELRCTFIYPKPNPIPKVFPFYGLANFILKASNENYWFSPEKLLYHYWDNAIELEINGDISSFTQYAVHYIGKATEQDIVKRLTGHSHLQDILSIENPLHYGSLPTDEIVLLFFKLEGNIHINSYDYNDPVQNAVDLIMGRNTIPDINIYLDAEKALINSLKPKHNRQLYANYPKSSDGLEKFGLDGYVYSFSNAITLTYGDGEIKGSEDSYGADSIIVKKNEKPIIIKNK